MLRPHTERIRSRTLIYQRLRGKRSHTRRLRGEDAHTKQNAHIPKATRRRTRSYTKGYEAKTLTYQTATRRRRSYEAERSHTEGYEAENLLIYQRLRSEDAHIPDGYEAKTLIRSRTLTYRRLRGGELAHIPKVTKRRRSHTTTATWQPTFLQPKGVENSSPKKPQNVRPTRRAGEGSPHHSPRLRELYIMAILHSGRAQAEELRLGSHRKARANEGVRQIGHHSHGLQTHRNDGPSTLDCPLHRN